MNSVVALFKVIWILLKFLGEVVVILFTPEKNLNPVAAASTKPSETPWVDRHDEVLLIMLRARPRPISESEVRAAAARVLGPDATVTELSVPGVRDYRSFGVFGPSGEVMCVRENDSPYTRHEPAARAFQRHASVPIVRVAIEHKSWIGVGFVIDRDANPKDLQRVQRVVGNLAAEFVDDACMMFLVPQQGHAVAFSSPEVVESVREGNWASRFYRADLPERSSMGEKADPEYAAANAEMARRLPEFIAAFRAGGPGDRIFRFLAQGEGLGGTNEVGFLRLCDVHPDALEGEVVEQSPTPGAPSRGQRLRVTMGRVVDWYYIDAQQRRHGPFAQGVQVRRLINSIR